MARDSWRFDPNEDYRNYDEQDNYRGRGNKNFRPFKKGKKFKKDKFDCKRRRHEESEW